MATKSTIRTRSFFGATWIWLLFRAEGHLGVDDTTNHTDVEPNEVQPAKDVVTTNDHAQVSN